MNHRNKTQRRVVHDVSGVDFSVNESLQELLSQEAGQALKKPWHRLDRGLRLNRLRAFCEEMKIARGLKDSEHKALLTLLTKSLDKKLLNSKTAVVYDPDQEKITEIKPLVMHPSSSGEVLFQLLEKRNAVTFRKRPSATESPSSPSA